MMLAIQEKPARTASLGVLLDLFERLHAEKIVYCHWKGNEHLGAALSGAKDVDLLVDLKHIPAVNDLAFDEKTGLRIGASVPCSRITPVTGSSAARRAASSARS